MISSVELGRIVAEWRMRLSRAKQILQPPTWTEKEWRQFSQALTLMVRDHGRSWIIDPNMYWDLRWNLQGGGELVCQIEHIPGQKTSLVVAQNGGFAVAAGSYTWLWAEFNTDGEFARDPYWVEGTWKDALTTFLLPLDRQSTFMLAGRAATPDHLLLQEGARPNDGNGVLLLQNLNEWERPTYATQEQNGSNGANGHASAAHAAEPVAASRTTETAPTAPEPVVAVHVPEPEPTPAVAATPAPIDTPAPFAIRWGMPQKLTWKDTDEIAYSLIDTHPDQDPLKLSLPKLHKLVTELEDFGDDPEKSNESILESIQMAWYEEVK
jgi:FeS assembly protein IscX